MLEPGCLAMLRLAFSAGVGLMLQAGAWLLGYKILVGTGLNICTVVAVDTLWQLNFAAALIVFAKLFCTP